MARIKGPKKTNRYPDEREKAITRDAAIKTEAHLRDFNRRFMKEHGLKSEKELMEYLNDNSEGNNDRNIE